MLTDSSNPADDKKAFKKRKRESVAAVAVAAPRGSVVARWRCWWLVAGGGAVSAQRSPLSWAMGSSQRLAAVAAVSHARHYYNHTQTDVTQAESTPYTVNIFFVRLVFRCTNSYRTQHYSRIELQQKS